MKKIRNMKNIGRYIVVLLSFLALSCQKIENISDGEGTLSVNVSKDFYMNNQQTRSTAESTPADATESELLNNAKVNIYKADFSGLVRAYTYSQMPSEIYLKADDYRVDVLVGEVVKETPSKASFTDKSYQGSKEFTITAQNNTTVEVVASVMNAVSNITFDPSIGENFSDGYTLTIALSDGTSNVGSLTYTADNSGTQGYFIISGIDEPSFNWTFSGTLKGDGTQFTKSGTISNIEEGKVYKMNLKYTIKNGDISFDLFVDYTTDIVDDTIVFEPVSTGLATTPPYEVWAAHTTLYADVDPQDTREVKFSYSSNGTDWTTVLGTKVSEGFWKADINRLTPSTEYTYRLILGDEQIDEKTLTTEAAPKIPNGSFEYASKVSGKNYYKFYDPSCGVAEGETMFWGSGNGEGSEGVNGSANMGIVITTIDTNDKVDGNQSVCAQTSSMVGILAAGNIFTGQFAGLVGTSGGKVNFGRPWTSRPTGIKLYCKYTTGKINIIKSLPEGVDLTKSDYDRAEIKVAIGTWDYKKYGGTKESPVHVNTTDASTFVDYNNDPSTIANGGLIIYHDSYSINGGVPQTVTTSEWIEYTIPLNYHDTTAYPTHIVVSCAASQYGDYFTGCDSSKLWIDKVELLYE